MWKNKKPLKALLPNCAELEGEKVNAGTDVGFIKTLRVFRVLRPLKSIQRIPKLQAVFNGFITSLVNVFPILIIYCLFMLIFAVIGVELYNGKFHFCSDASKMTFETCVGDMITPHFDHGELEGTVLSTITISKINFQQESGSNTIFISTTYQQHY